MDTAKKRWLSLYVENDVGVLAKISGLFSGKSYNLLSLTVGETEDPTVSRMTIGSPACCPHATFALETSGMIWSSSPSV